MHRITISFFSLILLAGCSSASSDSNSHGSAKTDPELLSGKHIVTLETTKGDITLELDADKAPKAVSNFVGLAKNGIYDNLEFHRVIPNFVIQGGDPSGDGTGGVSIFGGTFEDEQNDIQLKRGMLAMANRGPDTNLSQFFIIQRKEGTPFLQGKHTAFGKVIYGMNVVDAISKVKRDQFDCPITPVTFMVKVKK